MQSIPVAMTWEVLSRGRWAIAAATSGAIAFPTLILLALKSVGPFDPGDGAIITMHCALTHVNAMFFCVAIIYSGQGPLARMYAYPLQTSVLVAWRTLQAMLIIAVQSMVTTLVLNNLFDLNWPLLGPALFLVVVIAWANSIGWLFEKSLGWHVFALSVAAALLFTWFQWRYGFWGSSPEKYWQTVSAADAATVFVLVAGAFLVAVFGVARNRRGEPPFSLGVWNWLSHKFSARRVAIPRLGTPTQAFFHTEWRRKGWVMPAAVLFILAPFGGGWLLFDRVPNDLILGFLVGGGWLALAGVLGGIPMGNTGRNDSNCAMRQFTAALPISDQELARITLRTTAASALFAWLLWAVAFGLSYAVLATMDAIDYDHLDYPKDFHWWAYFHATLFGIWIAASAVTAIGLTGRSRLWLQVFVAPIPTIILLKVVSALLPPEVSELLIRSVVETLLGGIVLVTVGMYIVACRCQLLPSTTLWLVAVAALAVVVVSFIWLPWHLRPYWLATLVVAAAYSLVVAPLAAFPLAIYANRHR